MKSLINSVPSMLYPAIFRRIVSWAYKRAKFINQYGAWLTSDLIDLAIKMGVAHPEKIRIYSSHNSTFIDDHKLNDLLFKFGFSADRTCALTLFHSIALNNACAKNLVILAHEFRHVAQFESCGSLELYLEYYLMEVAYFGYGKGPLEVDAHIASNRIELS